MTASVFYQNFIIGICGRNPKQSIPFLILSKDFDDRSELKGIYKGRGYFQITLFDDEIYIRDDIGFWKMNEFNEESLHDLILLIENFIHEARIGYADGWSLKKTKRSDHDAR